MILSHDPEICEIFVPKQRLFNEQTRKFHTVNNTTLHLKHSLLSINKWEMITHRAFFYEPETLRNEEDLREYVSCMCLDQKVDPYVYYALTPKDFQTIETYMEAKMTASLISSDDKKQKPERITSEVIYFYMTQLNIWKDCEKWHINRLLTLIEVSNIKLGGGRKLTKEESAKKNREIWEKNRAREAEMRAKAKAMTHH